MEYNSYEQLAHAIVMQAVTDYRNARIIEKGSFSLRPSLIRVINSMISVSLLVRNILLKYSHQCMWSSNI